ncbi:MAG TPA: cysteine desulfurase family protein [Candidatus Limnocylindria bacterium]|nr:cysteine desulfurase family protein [Candidatus Limnocylindria bacterium]
MRVRYFDHNATHPLSPVAKAAWLDAVDRFPGNPSSPHRLGSRADAALQQARERLAGWLGCSPFDLVWTSGATEANNAIIRSLARATEGEVWFSAIEHPSVLASGDRWLPGRHRFIPVTPGGAVDLPWLEESLRVSRPSAVFVQAANNETGVLQPWRQVLDLCRQCGVPFYCDAAQWIGKLPAAGLGACDAVTGCAHKFGGPLGVGFMKCPAGFQPLVVGGPQEEGRRAGTENVPGILSMIAALAECETSLAQGPVAERSRWRDAFIEGLRRDLPSVKIVGEPSERLWNTVSAIMPPAADCRQRWVVKLDKQGFAVSTGSACSSGEEKPSHVLSAMGYPPDESDRMLRFSAGWNTAEADWEALGAGIRDAAKILQVF